MHKITQNGSQTKTKTIKLLEENIESLCDIGVGKGFLDGNQKTIFMKKKLGHWITSK